MKRRTFIKNAGMAGGMIALSTPDLYFQQKQEPGFPLVDLHVHLTNTFTLERVIDISKKTGVQFGLVVNPGYGVNDDASLNGYIDTLLPYPVYIGLQPMTPGWSKNFSPETLKRLDYIIMDAQTIPEGNSYNETLRIWNFDTYVDDAEKFMNIYMNHILEDINNPEPLTIFGWPLYLPVCIAPEYYRLWSDARMQQIIAALKKRGLHIEINDLAHTPHDRFISMAKEQGLKFAFGSDTRDQKAGRLDFCKSVAKKCNLRKEDFFIPARVLKMT